jgi:hypothetical protein
LAFCGSVTAAVPGRAEEPAATAAATAEEPAFGEGDGEEGEEAPPPPGDVPVFELLVVGRRPSGRDATEDGTEISGKRLRDSAQPTTLGAIARESADVHVTSRGMLHGVAAGASGGIQVGQGATRWRIAPSLEISLRDRVLHLQGADPGPVTHPHPDHAFDVWRNTTSLRLDWRPGPVEVAALAWADVGVHRLHDGFRSLDHTAGGRAEILWRFRRTAEVLAGLSVEHVGGDVQNRITGEHPEVDGTTEAALFARITLRPFDDWTVVFGSRLAHDGDRGFPLPYRAGVRWDVGADWQDAGRHTRQNPEAKLVFGVETEHAFGAHAIGGSVDGEWVHGLFMANYGRNPIPDVLQIDLAVHYRYADPARRFAVEPYVLFRNVLDRADACVEGYTLPGVHVSAGLRLEV